MRNAQADPNAVVGMSVESIGRHDYSARRRKARYFLEPSVAQPPLPLHEFLPLQPLSLEPQPPLPLQELRPLQACFSTGLSAACPAMGLMAELAEVSSARELLPSAKVAARATLPPTRPVK